MAWAFSSSASSPSSWGAGAAVSAEASAGRSFLGAGRSSALRSGRGFFSSRLGFFTGSSSPQRSSAQSFRVSGAGAGSAAGSSSSSGP